MRLTLRHPRASARRAVHYIGWALAKDTYRAWSDDYAPSMGAALSYYTLFSIAPLILIVVAVAGMVFGPEAARGSFCARQMVGPALVGWTALGHALDLLVSFGLMTLVFAMIYKRSCCG